MKNLSKLCAILAFQLTIPLQAVAQSSTPSLEPSFKAVDPCRATVAKFEETIGFIRQTQGVKAAADLKEKLIPATVEKDLLFKDGYCGLANYLRDKKLVR